MNLVNGFMTSVQSRKRKTPRIFVSSSADDISAAAAAAADPPEVESSLLEVPINMPPLRTTSVEEEDNSFAKLRKISNIASFLCVLDCTILPVVTIVFPLLGIVNIGAERLQFLHELGHGIALFFVMPVGTLTSTLNYMSHKKTWITSLAVIGLIMIALANAHNLPFESEILEGIQHGAVTHRVVNILGCSFLLGSNYLSQKQGCAHHDHTSDACSHDHDHDHSNCCSHDHSHHHHDHVH